MATRGRPPKPKAAKILKGTFRADRDGPADAQVRAEGTPVAPPHLGGDALAFWDQVVPGLVASGVARACDAPELAAMCEWWARYRRFSQALDSLNIPEGEVYRTLVQVGICWDKFERTACRFGLTPSDRARLRVDAPRKPAMPVPARKRG